MNHKEVVHVVLKRILFGSLISQDGGGRVGRWGIHYSDTLKVDTLRLL